MSGTGIPQRGDVLLQPFTGLRWSAETRDFSSGYNKDTESAHPGYYTVRLRDGAVRVALTATPPVALQRYTFQSPGRQQVIVDLQHVLRYLEGSLVIDSDVDVNVARGRIVGRRRVRNWADREVAFASQFDRAIPGVRTLAAREGEKAPRYLLEFDLGYRRQLEVHDALSTVDPAGALGNLAELHGRSFDQVRAQPANDWNSLLSRVSVDAPLRQRQIFYTSLYHALLHPSDIADADGRVQGPSDAVFAVPGGHYYSTLSLWDIARAQFPLLALLVPERVDGIVATLLRHEAQQGYLPLLSHAVASGFHCDDTDGILEAMVRTSTAPRPDALACAQRDWLVYEEFGYLPLDKVRGESVSQTLEFGWGDDAVARVAASAGRGDLAAKFAARAQGYHKLLDTDTLTMRGRDSAGHWRTPFDPRVANSPLKNPGAYTEAIIICLATCT